MSTQQVLHHEVLARADQRPDGREQEPKSFRHPISFADQRPREVLPSDSQKEGRVLRIEMARNSPTELGCQRCPHRLPEPPVKARAANRRLLNGQPAGQDCATSTTLFDRVALPRSRRANEPEPCASGILV